LAGARDGTHGAQRPLAGARGAHTGQSAGWLG
jgi:hypothetical protein